MRLRAQLLLLALATLVLPLAGWRFVRGLEGYLREGQAAALTDSAEVLARVVAGERPALPGAGPVFYVADARSPLRLDGEADDWSDWRSQSQCFGDAGAAPRLCVNLARFGGALHLLAEVDDAHVLEAGAEGDALRVLVDDGTGVRALRFAMSADGVLEVAAEDGGAAPTVRGEWKNRKGGYRLELRFAPGWLPRRMGVEALDRDVAGERPRRAGSQPDRLDGLWPLATRSDVLSQRLARLIPEGLHARLLHPQGWILADAGQLAPVNSRPLPQWRRWLYDLLVGSSSDVASDAGPDRIGAPEVRSAVAEQHAQSATHAEPGLQIRLSAVAPLRVDGELVGLLHIERRSEAAQLAQRALTGLLGMTLLAMLAVGGVLLAYASWLSLRVRKLGRAVDAAMSGDGQRRARFSESESRDEIGELSRRFGRLLDEVDGYTDYLRSLAGKLSHELHTPMAVVRSSLDNLESETHSEASEIYLARARDGIQRLSGIVRAMSESTRVERAIAGAEAEDFDLRELVSGCAEGYRPLLGQRRLELLLPPGPLPFHGAPDLLVQALDKLIDNARDFCPEDGWVAIALAPMDGGAEIAVANQGPTLPAEIRERLFDSLVSQRRDAGAEAAPHLGLGLYIVRLVTQLHRGEVLARDLPKGDGVEFRLRLRGMPVSADRDK